MQLFHSCDSMDNFNARDDRKCEPMTWTHPYGLWAHSTNVTEDAVCTRRFVVVVSCTSVA